jgi:hypothetical protein
MRLTTRVRLVAATIALASITAVMLTTTPASADVQAVKTVQTVTAPTHGDACTASPDSGPFFNFHDSCHWHDWCYAVHPYGGGYYGRLDCDNGFLSRMRSSCYNRYPSWWQVPARGVCYGIANDYYLAVRAAGWAFF